MKHLEDMPKPSKIELICLLVADRVINPVFYTNSGPGEALCVSELYKRNKQLISAFPEIFSDPSNFYLDNSELLSSLNCYFKNIDPREFLHIPGQVYESELDLIPSSTGLFTKRKKQGAYYTPVFIVKHMVKQALNIFKLKSNNTLKEITCLDPSCGGASFLIELLNSLVELGWPVHEAISSIYGVDIDPGAVDLSVFVLTVAVLDKCKSSVTPKEIKQLWLNQIKTANTLTIGKKPIFNSNSLPANQSGIDLCHFPDGGFDLVIGNPPYVSNKIIPPSEKDYYKQNFASAKGQYDLAVPFLEQGIELLKEDGVLCYITSNKFLAADYGKTLRIMILNDHRLLELIDVSTIKSFNQTAVYPVIIFVGKNQPSLTNYTDIYNVISKESLENAKPFQVDSQFFLNHPDYILTTQLNNSVFPLLKKLNGIKGAIPVSRIRCGIATSGFRRWVHKATKGNDLPAKPLYQPFIQAGHVKPFKILGCDYIDTREIKTARQKAFSGLKLVIPGMAKTLLAALDSNDSILGRVYYIRQCDTDYDLRYLVVLFNSQLLNFYYKVMYWPVHLEGGYIRFNSTYLATIPIYQQSAGLTSSNSKNISCLVEIGDRLINSNLSSDESEDIICQADAIIFSIYGFNKEEAEAAMNYNGTPLHIKAKVMNRMEE